jgi:signal transduction histidine kinase/ActR/RegA family two-component response regulator
MKPLIDAFSSSDGDPDDASLAARRFHGLTEALVRTSAHTGHDALQELTRALGEILNARRAHISRFCPEQPGHLRYVALWSGEILEYDGTFLIEGSASGQVLRDGECHYWDDLAARFPLHQGLYQEWGVCSYLGAPLIDSRGRTIGVISVMFGPGAHDRVLTATVFRLFTMRAASELDRVLVDDRRRNLENTLRAVVRGTASVLGEAFFNALVLELARALRARAVYLTRLHPHEPDRLVRLAGVENDQQLPSCEVYLPAASPTRETLANGYVQIADSLRERYPDHEVINRIQADSFIGVALRSARGEPLGVLSLLGVDPLQDPDIAHSMLVIFAARAAAEIQRIESDAAVARIDAQLRHTQKLEALGTLAGGIAHDFNNILAGILGNTQLAGTDIVGNPQAVERHLGLVVQGCKRARDLVARILAFSSYHEQSREPCALAPLVREALQLLEPSLPANVRLRAELGSDDVHILADPGQIHQIILNLGTNAAHALAPQGGTLEVSVTLLGPKDPWRARHAQVRPEHTVRLSIRDDGPGIPPELHDRIFEPFFTTKAPGEGSGLGLAGVHGMISAHEGAIVLESKPGAGATFHLCFARCEALAPVVNKSVPIAAPVAAPPRKRRVLFVDDERTITDIASISLKRAGWDPIAFNDPRGAIDAVRDKSANFDVVVSDLSMPGIDGATLAREVFALRPGLPVVIITGFMRPHEVELARKAGVRYFLTKPFSMESLNTLLDEVCAEKCV